MRTGDALMLPAELLSARGEAPPSSLPLKHQTTPSA
jgi:hypothetical protein